MRQKSDRKNLIFTKKNEWNLLNQTKTKTKHFFTSIINHAKWSDKKKTPVASVLAQGDWPKFFIHKFCILHICDATSYWLTARNSCHSIAYTEKNVMPLSFNIPSYRAKKNSFISFEKESQRHKRNIFFITSLESKFTCKYFFWRYFWEWTLNIFVFYFTTSSHV